jgi:hypothetical protein
VGAALMFCEHTTIDTHYKHPSHDLR